MKAHHRQSIRVGAVLGVALGTAWSIFDLSPPSHRTASAPEPWRPICAAILISKATPAYLVHYGVDQMRLRNPFFGVHKNAHGTYDRDLWMKALSPLYEWGFEVEMLSLSGRNFYDCQNTQVTHCIGSDDMKGRNEPLVIPYVCGSEDVDAHIPGVTFNRIFWMQPLYVRHKP